jgi:evolved beta-galactosidase subunit beta
VRERQQVGNGQVVIFENDEAYRFVGDSPVRKLIIKVTVEGGYFKTNNKPPVLH